MPDLVVTVPSPKWEEWLAEGDCAGEAPTGQRYTFSTAGFGLPDIMPDERIYVVARGRLRGYAPLLWAYYRPPHRIELVRGANAVAVTIEEPVRGFRGWRYRWWPLEDERPFPEWRTMG